MKRPLVLVFILILLTAANVAVGQYPASQGPAKEDKSAVQHGAQPNPNEVRPASPEGDSPSASAGELVRRSERRILGLPANAAVVIAGALIVIVAVGGLAIPRVRRYRSAR
jgi:hypothetical protein